MVLSEKECKTDTTLSHLAWDLVKKHFQKFGLMIVRKWKLYKVACGMKPLSHHTDPDPLIEARSPQPARERLPFALKRFAQAPEVSIIHLPNGTVFIADTPLKQNMAVLQASKMKPWSENAL